VQASTQALDPDSFIIVRLFFRFITSLITVMTVAPAQILTAETIPAYLGDRLNALKGVVDSVDSIVNVEPILGGNVNYAFCITLDDGLKIFLKQAPEFVAIFGPDGFPLTSERMEREMEVYSEWQELLSDYETSAMLPDIYYFDSTSSMFMILEPHRPSHIFVHCIFLSTLESNMVVIMQFLDGFELLDHVLVDKAGEYHPNVGKQLGTFMGQVHAHTHSQKVSEERKDYLTKHFENREMRDVQLEFVFTKCYKEATDEQRAGLEVTPEFMEQVELLKKQYNGGNPKSLVLTHGDLHPGSVMVNKDGETKVIDPEFTVYGPPGLDVGSLLSGYVLAAIHQAYSDNTEAVQRIVDGAQAVWDAYARAMKDEGRFEDVDLKEIEIETVGFTVAEVCRTALGFAGGRLWLQFDDASTKAAACKAAMQVVGACMIGRHSGGIKLLFDQMKAVAIK
jgi:5-methylthioribose kinase